LQADDERLLLERSIELTSQELLEKNRRLRSDLEEKVSTERAMRASELRYRTLIESMAEGLIQVDNDDVIQYVNHRFCEMLGYSPEEVIGKVAHEILLRPKDQAIIIEKHQLRKSGISDKYDIELRKKSGEYIWVHIGGAPLLDDLGNAIGSVGIQTDLSERRQSEEALEKTVSLLEATLESTADGILVVDNESRVVTYNRKFVELWGIPQSLLDTGEDDQLLGYVVAQLKDPQEFLSKVQLLYAQPDAESYDIIEFNDGRFLERYSLPHKIGGQSVGRVWSFRDVTGRKVLERELEHQAFHDPLTDLPNRLLFIDRLRHALARLEHKQENGLAVMFVDLDNFKVINDSLGHKIGDQLLVKVAERFQECLETSDTIARLGGDEFTILLEDIKDESAAAHAAERIVNALRIPFRIEEHEVFITTSIGIAMSMGYPHGTSNSLLTTKHLTQYLSDRLSGPLSSHLSNHTSNYLPSFLSGRLSTKLFGTGNLTMILSGRLSENLSGLLSGSLSSPRIGYLEDLLRRADIALYEAKRKGRARFEIFESDMNNRALERLHLESDLRKALERKEFQVYYQPVVDLTTGNIVKMEALIRWQHPERGLLNPIQFIPVAEETGMIVPIGQWVLQQACHQAVEWHESYHSDPPLIISVNLSARQFVHPKLVMEIAQTLADTGLDPGCLELEITESVAMEDAETAIAILKELKGLGIRLALDDFGTGYSALSYLKLYPVDTIKIDKSFVDGLGHHPEDTAIVRATIAFANALSLNVTAEGIETSKQLEELQLLQCEQGQGYLFARPMPAGAISAMLLSRNTQTKTSRGPLRPQSIYQVSSRSLRVSG